MRAIIVVGPAGAGNHLWHTLFYSMRWQGQRLIGTDMLGWTDGIFKTHDQEMFANVWAGRDLLASVLPADSPPLVTGRSVPCGRDGRTMPDIGGFYREAVAVGYEATIVIASRDRTITRNESIGKKKLAEFINGSKIKVPVRMNKGRYGVKTTFVVNHEFFGQHVRMENTDIDALQKEVQAWLVSAAEVKWEYVFLVEFDGSRDVVSRVDRERETEEDLEARANRRSSSLVRFRLKWTPYRLGTRKDGTAVYQDLTGHLNCGVISNGRPQTGRMADPFADGEGEEVAAFVPATPENEDSLRKLAEAISDLQERLLKMMEPENVQKFLAGVAKSTGLLRLECKKKR